MGDLIVYADFLDIKTDKVELDIKDIILDCEKAAEETINIICEAILDGDDDVDYPDMLSGLKDSIEDWFSIQEKKKERNM